MADDLIEELRAIAERLKRAAAVGERDDARGPLQSVMDSAAHVAKAWSGSNLGYQSRVYYADFEVPPPGAHFDSDWGFLGQFQGTTGDWREYRADDVVALVYERAGVDSLDRVAGLASKAQEVWTAARPEVISILTAQLRQAKDPLVEHLGEEAEKVSTLSEGKATRALVGPIGTIMTRDTTALSQGLMAAPHQQVEARVIAIRSSFQAARRSPRLPRARLLTSNAFRPRNDRRGRPRVRRETGCLSAMEARPFGGS